MPIKYFQYLSILFDFVSISISGVFARTRKFYPFIFIVLVGLSYFLLQQLFLLGMLLQLGNFDEDLKYWEYS